MANMEMDKYPAGAQELAQLVTHFVQEYSRKPLEQTDSEWLKTQLLQEVAGLTESAAAALSQEAVDTVCAYNQNMASLMEAKSQGRTAQEWFAEKAAASGMPAEELGKLHTVLEQANDQWIRTIDPTVEPPAVTDWTNCDPQLLAKSLGEQAVLAGIHGAAASAGCLMPEDLTGEFPPDMQNMIVSVLETGMDAGLKTAAAGALMVASERNLMIPENATMREVTDLACVAVENVKTLQSVANGTRTAGEALDIFGRSATAMYFDLCFAEVGRIIGRHILGWIPVVGPVVGEVIGYTIGSMVDTKVGEKIRQAAHKVSAAAAKIVKNIWNSAKETAAEVKNALKQIVLQ